MSGIKYRVWNMRRWLNDNEVSITPSGKILVLDRDEEIWRENVHYDLKVVRYTGLKDKNGDEIYEGDILKRKSTNTDKTYYYQVVWDEINARFMATNHMLQQSVSSSLEDGYEYGGTIYQNQELLEGAAK